MGIPGFHHRYRTGGTWSGVTPSTSRAVAGRLAYREAHETDSHATAELVVRMIARTC